MDSPFEVLGVDPDADEAAIDRAYRRRVIETHPDQGGSVRAFRRVKTAYERIQAGYEPEEPAPVEPTADESADAGDSDETEPAAEPDPTVDPDVGSRVEYLDYEVAVDQGWSLSDPELFDRAAAADLPTHVYGRFLAQPDETLLEAAEERGFAWPFACRGGACANCAVLVYDGELATPNDHILDDDLGERGFRLSCIASPVSAELQVVFNVKHVPELEELLLPADRFDRRHR